MDNEYQGEEWRPIPGYIGSYEVSSHGRVKSLLTNRLLKPGSTKLGYQLVGLSLNGQAKTEYVHTLVAITFNGDKPKGYQVNHIDRNPRNNTPSNLEYLTQLDNLHLSKKLNKETVKQIVDLFNNTDKSLKEIAAIVGTTPSNLSCILHGKSWATVTGDITPEARLRRQRGRRSRK